MTQAEFLSGLAFSRMQREHFSWTCRQSSAAVRLFADPDRDCAKRWGGFGGYIKPMPHGVSAAGRRRQPAD